MECVKTTDARYDAVLMAKLLAYKDSSDIWVNIVKELYTKLSTHVYNVLATRIEINATLFNEEEVFLIKTLCELYPIDYLVIAKKTETEIIDFEE